MFNELKTKKARIAHIKEQLATDPRWAVRGLLRIYEGQTAEEQNSEHTIDANGVGFNGVDAEIMSSFAKQVLKGRTLSPKQMAIVFKKIPKYAKQLEGVAQ